MSEPPVATLPDQLESLRALTRTPPPQRDGVAVARWSLFGLRDAVPELAGYSRSGMSRLVERAGIRKKRGRMHVHSPDPDYAAKHAAIHQALQQAREAPETVTVLFQDEAGIYRQPSLAQVWSPIGVEPRSTRSHHSNAQHRICGALDAVTGQVHWWAGDHTSVAVIRAFLTTLRQDYGPDRRLVLIWDNWPVHHHLTLVNTAAELDIELLSLPTYAPWLNPIEKLWRWLKQEVVHTHRFAKPWQPLKEAVATFLDRFTTDAPDLLRYCGLCVD